jgi:hypothetical protein
MFLYLEQRILKHRMHSAALRIKEASDGLDFYFAQKQEARKLVDFLQTVVPCRYKTSQELVSHDIHSNTFQYKHTFSVELVPVCKNEVVCLPLQLARSLGHMAQVVLCTRVTTSLHLTDPLSLQVAEGIIPQWQRCPAVCTGGPHSPVSVTTGNSPSSTSCTSRRPRPLISVVAAHPVIATRELWQMCGWCQSVSWGAQTSRSTAGPTSVTSCTPETAPGDLTCLKPISMMPTWTK